MQTNTIPARPSDGVDYGDFRQMLESQPFQTFLKAVEVETQRTLQGLTRAEAEHEIYRLQGAYSAFAGVPALAHALLQKLKPPVSKA
jgi:hypothetical protein